MLFIIYYLYKFIDFVKEKFNYSNTNSNKDELLPERKEQEFINFDIYSKTIIIDNDDNDNDNDNDNLIQK